MKTAFKFLATSAAFFLVLTVFSGDAVLAAETTNKWQQMEVARDQMCLNRVKDVCHQNIECEWNRGNSKCEAKESCMLNASSKPRTRVGCMTVSNRCEWYVPGFLSKSDMGGDDETGASLVRTQLNPLLTGIDSTYEIPLTWFPSGTDSRGGLCLSPQMAGIRGCVDAAWYELLWSPVDIGTVQNLSTSDPGYDFYYTFKESVRDCFSAVDSEFQLDAYTGPVFDGPGLFGGAELARRQLDNSISKETDLKRLVVQWTRFVLPIAAVIAVVAIIWAGVLWITDFGDGSRAEQGKKILLWTVAGILLILGSYAIVSTIMRAGWQDPRVEVTGEKTRCDEGCFWDGYDCKPTTQGNMSDEECTILK